MEVLVTDRGQPVPGLTKEDFQVFEDGQAAEVTSVFLHLGPADRARRLPRRDEPPWLSPAPPLSRACGASYGQQPAARGPGPHRALGRLAGDPRRSHRRRRRSRRHARPAGDRGRPGRSAAQERATIRQEIEQAYPPDDEQFRALSNAQARAIQATCAITSRPGTERDPAPARGLQQALALLSTLPERKALLYVGGGLPLRPGADLFEAWETKFGDIRRGDQLSPLASLNSNASRLVQETDRPGQRRRRRPERAGPAGDRAPRAPPPRPERRGGIRRTAARALRNLAAGTGGRVVTDVQNPAGFLERTGQ